MMHGLINIGHRAVNTAEQQQWQVLMRLQHRMAANLNVPMDAKLFPDKELDISPSNSVKGGEDNGECVVVLLWARDMCMYKLTEHVNALLNFCKLVMIWPGAVFLLTTKCCNCITSQVER